jgi:hypothetical protein
VEGSKRSCHEVAGLGSLILPPLEEGYPSAPVRGMGQDFQSVGLAVQLEVLGLGVSHVAHMANLLVGEAVGPHILWCLV